MTTRERTATRADVETLVAFLEEFARGRGAAKRASFLAERFGWRDRYLRSLAHAANQAGHLICADNAGYFVPASTEEVRDTVGRLRSQAFEMLGRAAHLEKLAGAKFRAPRPPRAPNLFDGAD